MMNNYLKLYCALILALLFNCTGDKGSHSEKELTGDLSLDGIWAENKTATPLFTISGGTITGYQQGDRTHFKRNGDTVLIYYEESVGKYLILKHSNDSLILKNEDGRITRLRRMQ